MVSLREAMAKVKNERIVAVSDGIMGSAEKGFYWKPLQEGQKIEGLIKEIQEGRFGDEVIIAYEEASGAVKNVKLPAHKDLQSKLKDLYEGDYVFVVIDRIQKSDDPQYNDKIIYKVEYVTADKVPQV